MPCYHAYTLVLDSELDIPELPLAPASAEEPDIRCRWASVPPAPETQADAEDGQAYRLSADEILYVKQHCGRFLVRAGREILVEAEPGVEERVVRLSLFGPALALALLQRGLLILHGGAVAIGDQAVLVLGPSGTGKSTMTAELCHQGGRILTDDVVVMDTSASTIRVLPGVPLLKLWPDAVDDAPEGTWTEVLHPDFDKVGRRMDDAQLAGPTPVARIFLLGGGDDLARVPLGGADAFRAIMMSLFAARYGEAFVSGLDKRAMLGQVTRLLETAPVEVLRRPKDRGLLAASATMVIDSLQ